MQIRYRSFILFAALWLPAVSSLAQEAGRSQGRDVVPHAGMLRYPDISADRIVFVYANDLWVVGREGGVAAPLASPPGEEQFPRFSPDGKSVAFVGNYDGDRDLYTVSVEGGLPLRVTHHPADEWLWDWGPDGRLWFSMNGAVSLRRQSQLFVVSPTGGLPELLPVPYGAQGALDPGSRWFAYTPNSRDHRTWKRYRGGQASDIWLFHLDTHLSRRVTTWEGTDTAPMWGNGRLYYSSDAGPAHRMNIWFFDPASGERRQVTQFRDFDIKWPAVGPGPNGKGEIIFQKGAGLFVLDLATEVTREVDVTLPGARPRLRPRRVDVSGGIAEWQLSPRGKRVLLEARGDLWTLPEKHGSPRPLTRTSGVAERDPAWSPDGRAIAYFTDATGEYELSVRSADGSGTPRSLTSFGPGFRYRPTWSPDSQMIAFHDKAGAVFVYSMESGQSTLIDTDPNGDGSSLNWSSDSRWLAYTKSEANLQSAVWLYHVPSKETHRVTHGFFNDASPTFDRQGKYLFLISNREFTAPEYEDLGTTFVYSRTDRVLAIPLQADQAPPWRPKSDEEPVGEDSVDGDADSQRSSDDPAAAGESPRGAADVAADTDADDGEDSSGLPAPAPEVVIDLDGLERRATLLPIQRGSLASLAVSHDHKLLYVRRPEADGGEAKIQLFDLGDEKKVEKTVLTGFDSFRLSADGKRLLVRQGDRFAVVDSAPDQEVKDYAPMHNMQAVIDPREEWRQLLRDAWRIQRDFFYDPQMHGVDWPAVYDQYAGMLADCASREDVGFVIGEMIAELNVGHAYSSGGDLDDQPRVSCGLLGCDFELVHENGHSAYRIRRIHHGAPWDVDARGPLGQPGLKVSEGDYLLAVDGVLIDPALDPWAALLGTAGQPLPITVSSIPFLDESARVVVVEPVADDSALRQRSWIEDKRRYVETKTDGRVGYVYVPDTGVNGQNELFRQFFGQRHKPALIIDERWNGGGQIPTRFIELLDRPATNYWAVRDGRDWVWPPDSHQGPKCMLINGMAGSGGDMFPALFRQSGLGPLIGTRTWGGLVGISGNPRLIDGAVTTAPRFAYYEVDGTWGIEGHGVDPDIEVIDDPARMVNGGDPQLDRAIQVMLEALANAPARVPERPKYPDRSGMGLPEADK